MAHAEQTWPGLAANVGEARRFVCRTLGQWEAVEFEWPAAAVVSELATNAVLHAGTAFAVALTFVDDELRVAVTDGSPARPTLRNYGNDSTTGRGLQLVVELADHWGIDPKHDAKTVWCVLTAPSADGASHLDGDNDDIDAVLARFEDVDAHDTNGHAAGQTSGASRHVA